VRSAWKLLGLGTVFLSFSLCAADYEYDPKVFAFLPEWCKYTPLYAPVVPDQRTAAEVQREIQRLNQIMGPQNFRHLHHYCRGLFQATRARHFEKTGADRDRLLRDSIGEFDYVLQRVEPTFVLLPEILTKKGESLVSLRSPDAIAPLQRAVELKPDYWPAYAALSDYFRDIGQLSQARQWLEKGLSAAPNASPLRRRLAEIEKSAQKAPPR
jgi:tetratricopeptide (TPR) repeat protein